MRRSLLSTFSDVFLLDLHGNIRKQEQAPDGRSDENVFDIQQGVAVGVFVKEPKGDRTTIKHCDLWGSRDSKYQRLLQSDVGNTAWTSIEPQPEHYFLVPRSEATRAEYERYLPLTSCFDNQNTGIQTKRDELFIDFNREKLERRFRDISQHSTEMGYLRERYGLEDSSGWSLSKLSALKFNPDAVVPVLYRPFDFRWLYFDPNALGRARETTMKHMALGHNIGLVTLRINEGGDRFVCLATKHVVEKGSLPRGNYSLFPLYLYGPDLQLASSATATARLERTPNFRETLIETLGKRLGLRLGNRDRQPDTVSPEEIFAYIYTIFHSRTYRQRYAEFLKIDFPRVPLTSDKKLFAALVEKGAELVSLHLMEAPKLNQFITKYEQKGEHAVEKVRWDEGREKQVPRQARDDKPGRVRSTASGPVGQVWINKTQYFEGVPRDVWEFHIGGYQVCEKWLKDRKGRQLAADDIAHYQKIVVALNETIRLMREIDEIIPGWPLP